MLIARLSPLSGRYPLPCPRLSLAPSPPSSLLRASNVHPWTAPALHSTAPRPVSPCPWPGLAAHPPGRRSCCCFGASVLLCCLSFDLVRSIKISKLKKQYPYGVCLNQTTLAGLSTTSRMSPTTVLVPAPLLLLIPSGRLLLLARRPSSNLLLDCLRFVLKLRLTAPKSPRPQPRGPPLASPPPHPPRLLLLLPRPKLTSTATASCPTLAACRATTYTVSLAPIMASPWVILPLRALTPLLARCPRASMPHILP